MKFSKKIVMINLLNNREKKNNRGAYSLRYLTFAAFLGIAGCHVSAGNATLTPSTSTSIHNLNEAKSITLGNA